MTDVDLTIILSNLFTVIPPTLLALGALRATRRVESNVGQINGAGTLAETAISQDQTLKLATSILDRMDERLEAVEKQSKKTAEGYQKHVEWHSEGAPERRKRT